MFSRNFANGSALVSMGDGVPQIFRQGINLAQADNADQPNRTLVVLQLAGGNDGLNTVIPYSNGAYYSLRKQIAVAADKVLKLDSNYGLHPGMTGLKSLYDAGQVAVVNGVGYPNPNYSHFRAMEIWQGANPDGPLGEGWVGKFLDSVEAQHNALTGLAIAGSLPREFGSNYAPVPTIARIADYRAKPGTDPAGQNAQRDTATLQMYELLPGEAKYGALLQGTVEDAFSSSANLTTIVGGYTPQATYPNTAVANGLKMIASVVAANTGLRVAHVQLGGFDTHSRQEETQAKLLSDLSDALAAFYQDLAAQNQADNTVTMTWSEFGRRANDNASAGTDHGSAEPMFVIGGPNALKGGMFGGLPSLTNLDAGNLIHTTDFRQVYATLLDKWLGADADTLLGQHWDRLDFLK
jgi:uncharacterized protein (DUF1501 family)